LPDFVEGYGRVVPFDGIRQPPPTVTRAATRVAPCARGREKLLADIEAAFVACGIADGDDAREEGRAVAILQYRDGRVTDIVRHVGG